MSNDLLSAYQFGFLKGRSTTLQLLKVLNDWTEDECLVRWVKNYLQDQSQFVEINGEKSQWIPVKSGIPQGSVLGPLLFLIYINDLRDNVNSTAYMYADDTKIYREIKSEYDHGILQRDLENLKTWSDRWLLKFHPSKCYYITIGQHNEEEFTYSMIENGKKFDMTKVSEMKDIGVIVDSESKFDTHINSKMKTANKILGIIRRSFIYLDADILLPLYKALVRSYFDNAMIIWNPHMVKHI